MPHPFAAGFRSGDARRALSADTPLDTLAGLVAAHAEVFLLNPVVPLVRLVDPGFFARLPRAARVALLAQPLLPAEILDALAETRVAEEQMALLAHPRTSEPTLRWLLQGATASAPASQVANALSAALGSSASLADALAALSSSGEVPLRRYAASHAQTGHAALAALSHDPRCSVRQAVATNPAAPVELHEALVREGAARVLSSMARSVETRAPLLGAIAGQDRVFLRCLVAENPAAPRALLDSLALDSSWLVRRSLAWNLLLPADLAARLSQDPDPRVRGAGSSPPGASRRA